MLIKKRYLMVLSVAVISVLLGSLYAYIAFAGKPVPQPDQVEVTNFPLDGEGNLKTTTVKSSKIMLVFNETLTVSSSVSDFIYLTSFDTSGFKYICVMAKGQGKWQDGANIGINVYENSFGIQTLLKVVDLDITQYISDPRYGAGTSGKYELNSMNIDLYFRVYNSNVGFDGLLTIAVYLSN